ncbi:MAG: hypothetical protein R2710_05585 [Acidimicrobiales bacterium]
MVGSNVIVGQWPAVHTGRIARRPPRRSGHRSAPSDGGGVDDWRPVDGVAAGHDRDAWRPTAPASSSPSAPGAGAKGRAGSAATVALVPAQRL